MPSSSIIGSNRFISISGTKSYPFSTIFASFCVRACIFIFAALNNFKCLWWKKIGIFEFCHNSIPSFFNRYNLMTLIFIYCRSISSNVFYSQSNHSFTKKSNLPIPLHCIQCISAGLSPSGVSSTPNPLACCQSSTFPP